MGRNFGAILQTGPQGLLVLNLLCLGVDSIVGRVDKAWASLCTRYEVAYWAARPE